MMHRVRGAANAVNADGCHPRYIPCPETPLNLASPPITDSAPQASSAAPTGRDAQSVFATHVPVMGAWQHNPYSLECCYERAQYGDDFAITPRTSSSLLSSSSFGSNDFAAAGILCSCTACVAESAFKTSRGPRTEKAWVRISGLSYTTSPLQIQEVFARAGLALSEHDSEPVNLLLFSGRPSGRAVAHMQSEQEAARAVAMLQGHAVNDWTIECQQISLATLLAELQRMARRQAKWMPGSVAPVGVDTSMRDPRAFVPAVMTGCCIKLVGFSAGTADADVIAFLHPYRVQSDGIHFQTRNGKPTGSCVVLMADGLEALRAATRKHKQYIGRRYIEVYPARPCDLHCDVAELKHVVRFVVEAPISTAASDTEENVRSWWALVAPFFEGLQVASVDACNVLVPRTMASSADSGASFASEPARVVFVSFANSASARAAVKRCVKVWQHQNSIVDFAESTCHDDEIVELLTSETPSVPRLVGAQPRVCTLWERSDTLRHCATLPITTALQRQCTTSSTTTRTSSPDPAAATAIPVQTHYFQEVTHAGTPATHWSCVPHSQQRQIFTQHQSTMPNPTNYGARPTYTNGSAAPSNGVVLYQ